MNSNAFCLRETCTHAVFFFFRSVRIGIDQQCKYCTYGTEFISTKLKCATCVLGKYQQLDNTSHVKCLTCNKGRDAPDNKTPCQDCHVGKYQPFDASITYTCSYCGGFEKAIETFNQVPQWPPFVDPNGYSDPTPAKWDRVGNFSLAKASYCPYFTMQRGRCDDLIGGVYIMDFQTCVQGATGKLLNLTFVYILVLAVSFFSFFSFSSFFSFAPLLLCCLLLK